MRTEVLQQEYSDKLVIWMNYFLINCNRESHIPVKKTVFLNVLHLQSKIKPIRLSMTFPQGRHWSLETAIRRLGLTWSQLEGRAKDRDTWKTFVSSPCVYVCMFQGGGVLGLSMKFLWHCTGKYYWVVWYQIQRWKWRYFSLQGNGNMHSPLFLWGRRK